MRDMLGIQASPETWLRIQQAPAALDHEVICSMGCGWLRRREPENGHSVSKFWRCRLFRVDLACNPAVPCYQCEKAVADVQAQMCELSSAQEVQR